MVNGVKYQDEAPAVFPLDVLEHLAQLDGEGSQGLAAANRVLPLQGIGHGARGALKQVAGRHAFGRLHNGVVKDRLVVTAAIAMAVVWSRRFA